MVNDVRRQVNEAKDAAMLRVDWCEPHLVWAIDPTELPRDRVNGKIEALTVQDLGSRYKFGPIAGGVPSGEVIAGHLDRLFSEFGPPLFIKRDNAGNLNHPSVNAVLEEHHVIPINSPVRYPQYNGGVEHAQSEIQASFEECLADRPYCPTEHVEAYLANAAHDRNHRPRRSLGNRTSCWVFTSARERAKIAKSRRKEVTDRLISTTAAIVERLGDVDRITIQAAWRRAAQQWLVDHDAIRVSTQSRVLPTSQKGITSSLGW
jgi:transposase InsO family protein